MHLILGTLALLGSVAAPEGFTDHGVAAKVAEGRGVVTTRDSNGRYLAIVMVRDVGSPVGYILVTDIDTGKTKQFHYPKDAGNSDIFASLMSRNGRFYTGAGKVLLEFDPTTEKWLYHGVPQPKAQHFVGAAICDGPDGRIYIGTYPNCHLVSYDPETQTIQDHGQLDPKEQYFNYLVFDSKGWAYAGIGTARCNLVAFHPQTGERRQLMPEEERKPGTVSVVAGAGGEAYAYFGGQWYRLFDGKAEKIPVEAVGPRVRTGAISWGNKRGSFPDGRQVVDYSVPERWVEVADAKGEQKKRIPLEFEAAGADITSLAAGPGGDVYISTCHPMHLARLETATGTLHDLGPIPRVGGGNFCAMDTLGNQLFGAAYAHGGLWAYDPAQPWKPAQKVSEPGNPRLLAEWQKDVCRPRTALAHPDGKHVLFAGFADYGYTGGGIGIVNVETGEATLLTADKDLLPGHSTITLKALPDGTLVGGTSIQAPGGGHVIAKEPELYLLDWKTKKVIYRAPVVPGGGDIISIHVGPDGLVYGLTANSTFFVFNPRERKVVHQESFAQYGGVPRHALQVGPDGKIYAMLTRAIVRITPGRFAHEKLADAPVTIEAGGALVKGRLYFSSGPRVWSYQVPGLR
jgi:streptogramin lyase